MLGVSTNKSPTRASITPQVLGPVKSLLKANNTYAGLFVWATEFSFKQWNPPYALEYFLVNYECAI